MPSRRTIIGMFILPSLLYASITPLATRSQRTIPPNILIRIAFTLGSFIIMRKPASTVWAFAPPPTSRKFAGSPPLSFIISMVAIARPAPFTIQPTLPSSFTKFRLNCPASTSVGSSSVTSRIAARSGWRISELSSSCILQSTAIILSSLVLNMGFISTWLQSRPT